MDDYLTIYRKDYVPKEITKLQKYGDKKEFDDPLGEGFRQYLKLKTETLKPREQYQEDYMQTVKTKYPEIYERYFSKPIDIDLVRRNFNLAKQTIYQGDYCDMEKRWDEVRQAQLRAREIKLPDGWIIPLTTTAFTYRNPTILKKDALKVVPPILPERNSFGMSKQIQDILHITTGKSEYGGVIGELGRIITEDQIHGKIIHPLCGCGKHNRIPKNDGK